MSRFARNGEYGTSRSSLSRTKAASAAASVLLAAACSSGESSPPPASTTITSTPSYIRTGEVQIPEDNPSTNASSTANSPNALPQLPHTYTYDETVQTQDGARTFDYFNATGEGSRIPRGTSIKVDCIAHDPNNEVSSVIDGDWYVIDANGKTVPGVARITPTNSYDNTTDPSILRLPLNQQPVYDPKVPFCSPEQLAVLHLSRPQ